MQAGMRAENADWPQFMGNPAHTGDASSTEVLQPLVLKARIELEDAILTSAAVVDDRIYVVDQMGTAYCLNVGTGAVVCELN